MCRICSAGAEDGSCAIKALLRLVCITFRVHARRDLALAWYALLRPLSSSECMPLLSDIDNSSPELVASLGTVMVQDIYAEMGILFFDLGLPGRPVAGLVAEEFRVRGCS